MKLSKDTIQKIVLGIIGYAVFFTVFNNFILKQINADTEKKKIQLATIKATYDINLQKTSTLEEKKKEWLDKTQKYNDKISAFIFEKNKKALLNEIEERAKLRNIRLDSVTIATNIIEAQDPSTVEIQYDENGNPIEPGPAVQYKEMVLTIKVRASFNNIVRYLEELEKMKKMVSIKSLSIKREENELSIEMVLKSYIIPEEGAIQDHGKETNQ